MLRTFYRLLKMAGRGSMDPSLLYTLEDKAERERGELEMSDLYRSK
jgi:hypothetical protein